MTEDKCESCRFWRRYDDYKIGDKHVHPDHGDCRKKAPVVIIEGGEAGMTASPATKETGWCGDFEGKD